MSAGVRLPTYGLYARRYTTQPFFSFYHGQLVREHSFIPFIHVWSWTGSRLPWPVGGPRTTKAVCVRDDVPERVVPVVTRGAALFDVDAAPPAAKRLHRVKERITPSHATNVRPNAVIWAEGGEVNEAGSRSGRAGPKQPDHVCLARFGGGQL